MLVPVGIFPRNLAILMKLQFSLPNEQVFPSIINQFSPINDTFAFFSNREQNGSYIFDLLAILLQLLITTVRSGC